MTIKYNDAWMHRKAVGNHGISSTKVNVNKARQMKAHQAAITLLDSGEQGFIKTLFNSKDLALINKWSEYLSKSFSQILLIGIGGSDLGARALNQIFPSSSKKQVFFLGDTADPIEINRVCSAIDWKKCAVIPVSKSGSTVETITVFLYARDLLIKAVGKEKHKKHIYMLTEDNPSVLHNIAIRQEYTLIPHPQNIGGRWTVLSIVALLSSAFTGANVKELRKGARDFYNMAKLSKNNPAMKYAMLHYLGCKQGQSLAVLMPYSSRLESFGAWYRQLFAESLGKAKNRKGKIVNTGVTPIVAVGPKDQHSQVQLYNDGPYDKLITFIRVESTVSNEMVPKHWKGEESIAYLDSWSYHDLLNIEQESTAQALKVHKRPSGTISIPELSEYYVGQLFILFELACVYLAELFDINAFDQPGVEEGKQWMKNKLTRR